VPGADVRVAPGETLPFADGAFATALSQLVLSFVQDGARFVAEQRRVVHPGGVIAACMWEAGRLGLVAPFWDTARALDPGAPDESAMPYRRADELEALWRGAGLAEVRIDRIAVDVRYDDFDDYWAPFEYGIGPAGAYLVALPDERRVALRDAVRARLGDPVSGFTRSAVVVAVRGVTPS
jgi:SAM-dependent methyltransferase